MSRLPSVNGIPCRLKWKIWKACFHYRNLSPAMQSTTGSFFERPDCPFPSLKFINDSFWHISPAARFLSWSSLTGQHLVWWCFITCSPSFALVFYGPLSLSAILSHTKIRNISFFFLFVNWIRWGGRLLEISSFPKEDRFPVPRLKEGKYTTEFSCCHSTFDMEGGTSYCETLGD